MQLRFYMVTVSESHIPNSLWNHLSGLIDNNLLSEALVFPYGETYHLYTVQRDVKVDREVRSGLPGDEKARLDSGLSGLPAIQQFYWDVLGKGTSLIGDRSLQQGLEYHFSECLKAELIGPVFRKLWTETSGFAEEARETTELSAGAVIPAYLSYDLAGKIMEDTGDAKVTILGEHAEDDEFLRFWSNRKINQLYFVESGRGATRQVNNTTGYIPVPKDGCRNVLKNSDVIILNARHQESVITDALVQENLRNRRQRHLLIFNWEDRDSIESEFIRSQAVFLYSREEMEEALSRARDRRQQALDRLNPVLNEAAAKFYEWFQSDRKYQFHEMVGASREMQQVFDLIRRVASTDITVLIQGETGTGKEMAARAIHDLSQRRNGSFVPVNCGAIPETLLESELFGHKKGAFTGADSDRTGLLKEASGGTVFLDEIADTPQSFQVKLLRALQEREITPVGSNKPEAIDVRIITATRQELEVQVERGNFRSDLYYRINVVKIELPPLRHRKDDILPLVRHFIRKYNERMGKKVTGLSAEANEVLHSHRWDGNVRELENVIERAIALTLGDEIRKTDLPEGIPATAKDDSFDSSPDLRTLEEVEQEHIANLLREYDGKYEDVAEILGIGRTTLWRKMKKYGLS
ncbi:MAG: sigma 54-interacting transcriptional regulator [Candidatus Marinimicrobia bacterium]|nr:sigma 54-interacting transcriptional regulator [Candidatus Neomarinimicrobiota bacterium]MCF7830005.1 sigma 54-interacting transcriptional regulator [Candidatus Neomarinimicrobiota bacterium]MCF7881953.1 sigma 54-interacting transcriptional regulator [Candidatus Neomarinimicrobiota bacterium]